MSKIIINGTELELDVTDADQLEAIEAAMKSVSEAMNSDALSKMTAPDMIRTQCCAVFAAFNMIFGDGTDRAVFGGKCSLMEAMEAFARLVGEIENQKKLMEDMTSKLKSQASALKVDTSRAASKAPIAFKPAAKHDPESIARAVAEILAREPAD